MHRDLEALSSGHMELTSKNVEMPGLEVISDGMLEIKQANKKTFEY